MATAKVIIKGEDQLKGPLNQASQELNSFGQAASGAGNMLQAALGAAAVAVVIKAVKEVAKAVAECVNEFKEQIEVDTKLQAVLKATDQQYKYTAREIKEFANALQSQTRFGDEAIESAAQLLIATKKFSKEGLERTLELSADLAEAMGTDITSAASTLERALIAPGEGLNKLKTIGITFTDAEKNMINELKNAGKEFEAQQVILDKVEDAYGGIAKSIGSIDTSYLDKIKSVWGDLKQDLGNVFTNTLGPVFKWIYETLSWLQRLANQAAEKSNLKKYMNAGDVTSIANNYTAEYLNEQLSKTFKDYNKAITLLMEDYADVFLDVEEKLHINVEEFLEKSQEEQWDILKKVLGEDDIRTFYITQIADDAYETVMLTKAIELQQEQAAEAARKYNYELLNAQAQQSAAVVEAVGGVAAVFDNTKLGLFDNATVDGLTGNILNTIVKGYFGSGILDSAYMSIMYGELGMWTQTTDAFMLTMYDWGDDFTDKLKNLELKTIIDSPTLTALGLDGLRNINFKDQIGTNELQTILNTYGKNSRLFQEDLLKEEINYIDEAIESAITLAGEDSPIVSYLIEIYGTLNNQLTELKKKDKGDGNSGGETKKGSLGKLFSNIGNAVQEIQDGVEVVLNDFTSQTGEFGDFVSRLVSNMAQYTPVIGLIVTALHYVIEGFVEVFGDMLQEFAYYGLEPLREIGRVIADVLMPILEDIMPSIQNSADFLIGVFDAIGTVLKPIAKLIGSTLGPVLNDLVSFLEKVILPIIKVVATFLLIITSIFEAIAGGLKWIWNTIRNWFGAGIDNPAPKSYPEILEGHLNELWNGTDSESSAYGTSGTTNASYQGSTTVYLNVYNNGYIAGDNGIQEFAIMIRDEIENINYYHR